MTSYCKNKDIFLTKINKLYLFFSKKSFISSHIQQPGHTERFINQLKDTQVLKCLSGVGPIRQNSLQAEMQFVHGLKQFEHFI